jgi:hypothetical protein
MCPFRPGNQVRHRSDALSLLFEPLNNFSLNASTLSSTHLLRPDFQGRLRCVNCLKSEADSMDGICTTQSGIILGDSSFLLLVLARSKELLFLRNFGTASKLD